jgi:hypothetical protein
MQISAKAAPNTLQSGPIAVLGPQGSVCEPNTTSRANRVGQSTVPVLWSSQEFDGDGNFIGNGDQLTSAQVNDYVQPGAGAFFIVMCATNTSSSTAQLNFNLLGGQ